VERGYLQQFMPSYVKINHRESGLADLDAGRRALIDQKIYWEFSLSALLQEDRFSDAMKLLELMEQKGLETIRSRDMLIQYALECQLDSAEPLYEHLLQSDIGNPLIIDICSKRLLPWKEETELLKVMDYLRCLKKEVNEKEPISLFQLGLAYVELSEASRQISGDTMGMAMDLFRQILNRDESLRSVYGAINRTILAVYHRIPEILENGSKYIEKAHQLFPEDPYILGLMGYLLDGTGGADKKQDAANFFEESLRWDYTQPRIHHALAGIYRFQKNHQKATFHYRLVLELSRDIKLKDEAERALNYLKRMESEG
jgi:tetratricopeptide (TPR) repeat protein